VYHEIVSIGLLHVRKNCISKGWRDLQLSFIFIAVCQFTHKQNNVCAGAAWLAVPGSGGTALHPVGAVSIAGLH